MVRFDPLPEAGKSTNEKVPAAPVVLIELIVMEPLPLVDTALQPLPPIVSSALVPTVPETVYVPGPLANVAKPNVCVAASVPAIDRMPPLHVPASPREADQFAPSIFALIEPCGRFGFGPTPPSPDEQASMTSRETNPIRDARMTCLPFCG